jgi:release factor glutamine methyltransferase
VATIAQALAATRRVVSSAEARLLLAHVTQQPPVWLLTHDDHSLPPAQAEQFEALLNRRMAGEPVAYLLGYREFYGRRFSVSPDVLIPRPETELLVDVSLQTLIAKVGAGGTAQVLDLGTGSGCIALSIALEQPAACVTGIDASAQALAIASGNAQTLQATVTWVESDWFAALGTRRFDLIVSNPPYIAERDPHLDQGDLRHEPAAALTSGGDGLTAIRTIIKAAPRHLQTDGVLWLEHGYDQAAAVRELLLQRGFAEVVSQRDLAGIERISGGRWSGKS